MRFWKRWTQSRTLPRDYPRDPDLDLVKHMTEQHEWRIALLEEEADRIAAGRAPQFRTKDRRHLPRDN